MSISAKEALDLMQSQSICRFEDMPDGIGIYGLADHEDKLHYIGMTDSKCFKDRIWNRHISGSEDRSHKLACNYAVGRLWHDRKHPVTTDSDGAIARRVRRAFIRKHCGFVCIPLSLPKPMLRALEADIIKLAWPQIADWNKTRKRVATFEEPVAMVDVVMSDLKLTDKEAEALDRQNSIYLTL